MTDIQSASSVSRIKTRRNEVLCSVVSFHDRQSTVLMPFLAVVFVEV